MPTEYENDLLDNGWTMTRHECGTTFTKNMDKPTIKDIWPMQQGYRLIIDDSGIPQWEPIFRYKPVYKYSIIGASNV